MVLCLSGCAFITVDLNSLTRIPGLEERVLKRGTDDKVLVVEVLGPITTTAVREALAKRQGSLERIDSVLTKAKKDKHIKGVILKIDSPGVGVTASDLIYRRILEYKAGQKVPVVACITNMGASGGYMVALAADRIVALPTSTVGSVGVLLPSVSVEGLIDKLGIRDQTLTSGKYKGAGSVLKDMGPDDKAIYEEIIQDFYQDFLSKVKARRPVNEDDLKVIGDGRIMTARSGLKYHLVDEVGYYEDALKAIEQAAKIKDPTVVLYRRQGENSGGFYSWP
ncbi:MAG TPA: signal peptide peptidase SppA [Deltaproteobacteria bacterium]|nr:signal peptide peptidase SppA [Deltaproteobacteria bacterium]